MNEAGGASRGHWEGRTERGGAGSNREDMGSTQDPGGEEGGPREGGEERGEGEGQARAPGRRRRRIGRGLRRNVRSGDAQD